MIQKYIVITPVRDEEKFIQSTIESVASQTIRPVEWVIVNDGSSDKTGEIADRYAAAHPWIQVIHRQNRGFRKSGGGVMEAFYDGFRNVRSERWDFVVKLDGDLTFSPDYFERCLEHFDRDPKLGVGGGEIHHDIAGTMKLEATPRFHVRGATKIYRRQCWDAIGGLWPAPGWDTIDEVKANMLGWKTYSFPELHLHHHRFTGTEEGLLRDKVKVGVACYVSGYHPLFVAASCVRRLVKRPYLLGSFGVMYGFLKSHFARSPRMEDRRYRAYIRGQQMRKLLGLETIWR